LQDFYTISTADNALKHDRVTDTIPEMIEKANEKFRKIMDDRRKQAAKIADCS
jgi:DNA-directed RNA polymerase subunit F